MERQKLVTSGQNFEEFENSVLMRACFEELIPAENIIAKVLNSLAAQIRKMTRRAYSIQL